MQDQIISEFQRHVNGFKNSKLTKNEALANWALGIGGESGEVVDCIKKALFHGKGFDDLEPVKKELGDLMWYVFALCDELGLDFEDVLKTNIIKLQSRHEGKAFNIDAANINKAKEGLGEK